jgi:hypothetical protein
LLRNVNRCRERIGSHKFIPASLYPVGPHSTSNIHLTYVHPRQPANWPSRPAGMSLDAGSLRSLVRTGDIPVESGGQFSDNINNQVLDKVRWPGKRRTGKIGSQILGYGVSYPACPASPQDMLPGLAFTFFGPRELFQNMVYIAEKRENVAKVLVSFGGSTRFGIRSRFLFAKETGHSHITAREAELECR